MRLTRAQEIQIGSIDDKNGFLSATHVDRRFGTREGDLEYFVVQKTTYTLQSRVYQGAMDFQRIAQLNLHAVEDDCRRSGVSRLPLKTPGD